MIRAVHLYPERLTHKEGIQEGLAKEIKSVDGTPSLCLGHSVDTTNRYREHSVKIRVRQNDKSDQVSHGKIPAERPV